jgi:plastocyanin
VILRSEVKTVNRYGLPALLLAGLALAAAGCGGSSSNAASGGQKPNATGTTATQASPKKGRTLRLAADASGALRFDKKSLTAPPGKVTIVMTNDSSVPHDIALEGNGVDVIGPIVTGGGKSTVSVNLKLGTYTFYCSVDAHKAAGMVGTLTIR